MLECWNAGVLECWNAGMLECWNAGMLECWNAGMLECWNECRLLALVKVRFANGWTLSFKVLPTQALGRTGWLLAWLHGRLVWVFALGVGHDRVLEF
jgi:hypothetical protein